MFSTCIVRALLSFCCAKLQSWIACWFAFESTSLLSNNGTMKRQKSLRQPGNFFFWIKRKWCGVKSSHDFFRSWAVNSYYENVERKVSVIINGSRYVGKVFTHPQHICETKKLLKLCISHASLCKFSVLC